MWSVLAHLESCCLVEVSDTSSLMSKTVSLNRSLANGNTQIKDPDDH